MRTTIAMVLAASLAGVAAADDTAPPADPPLRHVALAADVSGPLYGWYDVALTTRITRHVAVALAVTDYSSGSSSQFMPSSYDGALTAVVYAIRAYEGPYLEGGVVALDQRGWDGGTTDIYKSGVRALVGWQHTIDFDELALTVSAAIGGETIVNDSRYFPGRGLTGYLRVGIAL